MNPDSPARTPGLRSLFANDFIFKGAARLCGFGLMIAAGFWWMTQPMPNATVPVDVTFEKKVPPIALAVAAVGLLVALWRYGAVRKVFTQGALIRGTVEEMKTDAWQTSAGVDQSHGSKTQTRHSYYATLRYTAQGAERTIRQKLPSPGSTYGLKQGGEVELMVLDSKPDKPFIRAVYLGR